MPASVICVDASFSLKLILPEPDSEKAHEAWQGWLRAGAIIIAPTLWAYEVTSVIRNRTHRGLLDLTLEAKTIETAHDLPVQLLAPDGLHKRAWQLARRFDRPAAYDAHYLALAEMTAAQLWTADKRLYRAVRNEVDWVHCLALDEE